MNEDLVSELKTRDVGGHYISTPGSQIFTTHANSVSLHTLSLSNPLSTDLHSTPDAARRPIP
jgi:hypothetical protein